MSEFIKQLSASLELTRQQAGEVVASAALEIFRDTVTATPVDTGAARSNWRLTVDAVDTSSDKTSTGTENQAQATGTISAVISGQTQYTFISISNNLPYIRRLEYGYSGQAPTGMLRNSLNRFNSITRKHAKRVMGRKK